MSGRNSLPGSVSIEDHPLTRRVIGHYFPGRELNTPTFRLPTRRCTGSRKKVTPGDTSRAVYRCGVTPAC
jgi:hypothetical protein